MQNRFAFLVALAVLLVPLSFSGLQAQKSTGFRIIVNAANPAASLTTKQVSNLFLRKTSKWKDGRKVTPVDLAASSEVRADFSQAVHRKSVSAVKSYWAQSIFSGFKGSPPELKSEAEVVAYVEANQGAIGYVSTNTRTTTAKVLPIKD